MPIIRGETSRGLHIRALLEAMLFMLEALLMRLRTTEIALRNHMAALLRAYPELQGATDLAQAIAEMDGNPVQDQDP